MAERERAAVAIDIAGERSAPISDLTVPVGRNVPVLTD
jgi:hypothetical protein